MKAPALLIALLLFGCSAPLVLPSQFGYPLPAKYAGTEPVQIAATPVPAPSASTTASPSPGAASASPAATPTPRIVYVPVSGASPGVPAGVPTPTFEDCTAAANLAAQAVDQNFMSAQEGLSSEMASAGLNANISAALATLSSAESTARSNAFNQGFAACVKHNTELSTVTGVPLPSPTPSAAP